MKMKYKIEQISYFFGYQSIRKIYIPLSFHKLSTNIPLIFKGDFEWICGNSPTISE